MKVNFQIFPENTVWSQVAVLPVSTSMEKCCRSIFSKFGKHRPRVFIFLWFFDMLREMMADSLFWKLCFLKRKFACRKWNWVSVLHGFMWSILFRKTSSGLVCERILNFEQKAASQRFMFFGNHQYLLGVIMYFLVIFNTSLIIDNPPDNVEKNNKRLQIEARWRSQR